MIRRIGHSGFAIGAAIIAIATFNSLLPDSAAQFHNFVQHLYFLPLIVAGIRHGWRGATLAAALAAVFQVTDIARKWDAHPYLANDQMLEFPIFAIAGLVSGLLSEQERTQRRELEMTKKRLEVVLDELSRSLEEVKRSERLSAAGQLAAGLAHEIRNPLASLTGIAGLMKRGPVSPEQMQECIEIIGIETTRLNRLLSEFLQFARPRAPRIQPMDLWSVIEAAVTLARHTNASQNVALRFEPAGEPPEIEGDPELIKQVLLNLLLNAIEASPEAGQVRITAKVEGRQAVILIHDEGPGITPEAVSRVFDPFYTTKTSGTGLGLAVAKSIVQQHGGELTAQTAQRGGAFRLQLPLQQGAAV